MRLIPTCVGSTSRPQRALSCPAAHPHVCGEHPRHPMDQWQNNGSSPRVWGAPQLTLDALIQPRLIPTCVGSTAWAFANAPGRVGSSPRVWGAQPAE